MVNTDTAASRGRTDIVRKVLSEFHNWRDYVPAALWAVLMLSLAAVGPIWAALT